MDHCSNGIDLDTPVSGHMRDPPHNRADLHTTEHCASHNLAVMLGRLPQVSPVRDLTLGLFQCNDADSPVLGKLHDCPGVGEIILKGMAKSIIMSAKCKTSTVHHTSLNKDGNWGRLNMKASSYQ